MPEDLIVQTSVSVFEDLLSPHQNDVPMSELDELSDMDIDSSEPENIEEHEEDMATVREEDMPKHEDMAEHEDARLVSGRTSFSGGCHYYF